MTFFTRTGKQLPKVIVDQAENAKKDEVSRREFLALASTYGATAATYSLLGMAAPKRQVVKWAYRTHSTRCRPESNYDWSQSRTLRGVG